jgi:hypothetical protein
MNSEVWVMRKELALICLVVGVLLIAGCIQKEKEVKPKELKLSDFPDVFKENTLIVIGDNASEIELEAANEIAGYLENKTGNKALVKKYSEVTEEEKRNYNLIVVGTPNSNPMLKEVYAMADVLEVNETFPGEGKGILEILRNPWDEEKAMLLVEGWDRESVLESYDQVMQIFKWREKYIKSKGEEVELEGIIDIGTTFGSSWYPRFDECGGPPIVVIISNEKYYLANLCPYWNIVDGDLTQSRVIIGETESIFPYLFKNVEPPIKVRVKGKLETRKVEKPLIKMPNPPTETITVNVIVVSDLKVVR